MQDYTESKEYDLIILLSYHAMDAAIEMGKKYPSQKYLIYDVAVPGYEYITSESFAKNQLGFVAGVFAALMDAKGEITINGKTITFTPSSKFGAMISMELTSTVGAITGFYAGVHYINPGAEIQYVTVGSWTDQATAKELALTVYNNGANILFHNAGGAFLGAVEAAKTVDKFAIGYDANQNSMDATHIIASSHKQNTEVIVRFFDDFCNGIWKGGTNILNGYNNKGAKLTYQNGLSVPVDVQVIMDDVIAKIQNGDIVPPNSWDESSSFNLTYKK
ncbi:MAG: BMP family protein [Sphaerochaetaceae bacterium]